MDTREKIVSVQQAADAIQRGRVTRVVTAYCDPLLPEHIDALSDKAGEQSIAIALLTPDFPLLSPRARAELAAALSFVALVFVAEDGWERHVSGASIESAHYREAELREALIAYVRDRARRS